ncbi:hypothetical protein QJS10_CPB21g00471 [Acorus calamus]|uniref:Uncharacterized protein n=1 Tax=Acorus calamus TaxID=4465 RepID=A0AAV9C7K2_ACOCL|nr:hypothetical protein QJS10_CPB21g00471 [Acorus calamus]
MGYIGLHGVQALHRYRYSDYADWVPVLTRISPTWICKLDSALSLFLVYSPHLDTAPPRWVHLAHALLLFLYQTFDAVDGKQARRTNSSSPLGELFDHGCDALACAFETLAFGSTAMSGKTTFWIWVISAIPFYCATWEHFFTNSLILPVINGPTEGLMMIYMFHFFTFFVGAEWWAQDFRISFPFLSWVPLLSHIPGKKWKHVVGTSNGNSLCSTYLAVFLGCYLSPSDIMRNYPHLLIVGTGFAFGYLVGRMILAHLCDEPKGLKTGMCLFSLCPLYFPFILSCSVFLNNLFFSYESALCVYQFHSTCILPHQWFMKLLLLSASTVSGAL